jgi:hypothetical protein
MKLTIVLVTALLTCDALAQQRTVRPGRQGHRARHHQQPRLHDNLRRLAVSLDARPLTAKAPPRFTTVPVARRARYEQQGQVMMIEAIWMPLAVAVVALVTTMLMAVGPPVMVATGQRR